jgi:hypothetical protein
MKKGFLSWERLATGALVILAIMVCFGYWKVSKQHALRVQQDVQQQFDAEASALLALQENAKEFGLGRHYYDDIDRALAIARVNIGPSPDLEIATMWISSQQDIPPRQRQLMEQVLSDRFAGARFLNSQAGKAQTYFDCQRAATDLFGEWLGVNCPQPLRLLAPSLLDQPEVNLPPLLEPGNIFIDHFPE